MRLKPKIWLCVGALIVVVMAADTYIGYRDIESRLRAELDGDARIVRAVLMATRRVYHEQFVASQLPVTESTVGFLPAHALSRIAADFPNWIRTGLRFNNVSDRARNPANQADTHELAAMEWFRANPMATDHVAEIRVADRDIYHFTAPIWIEPYCLGCHGERQAAPPSIRDKYPDAYGYQLGDLRGVMSIKLPMDELRAQAFAVWWKRFGGRAGGYAVLLVLLGVALQQLIVRRLVRLALVTRKLKTGDLSARAEVSGSDEIMLLAASVNDMAGALEQRQQALMESEQRFRSLTEMSSDFYWESDAEHRLTMRTASKREAAEETFGQASPIGQRRWEIAYFSPDEAGWKKHRETLDAHFPFRQFEISRPRPNGVVHHISISGNPVFNAASAFTGYRGVGADITERKLAEIELRSLSRAMEQSPASIVITDRAGIIEYVNRRFEEVTGYTKADVLGRNPRILKSGETKPETYRDLWQTIAEGGEWRGELCNRRRNGELFCEFAAISGITGPNGEIEHYVAVKEDITERKQAADALNQSEARLAAVFHASPIAMSVTRVTDGKVLEVNDASVCLFGHAREDLLGRTSVELGIYANPARRAEMMQQLRELQSVERFRVEFRTRSGKVGLMEVSGRIIELRGEQCMIAMMEDVTERKRLEEMHLQAQKLESLGTLAGGIAHDFNNILAAIRGNVDLAAEDVGPDHIVAESLEEIKKASTRASELVRRIMAFGRPKDAHPEVVDVSAVTDEVLKLLRSTLPAGISFRKDFAADTPHVLADAGQLHEIIVNLTTNAAYAIGPRSGSIEYRLQPVQVGEELAASVAGLGQGSYARLTVTDSGCGMDAATLERIFDAFYTTKPVGEGTGLGLSMVHGIVKAHGGAVMVESSPGQGSSFHL